MKMFNRRIARRIVALLVVPGATFGTLGTAVAQVETKTVWDGVYTAAQAERGGAAYAEKCSQCHEADLSGYRGILKRDRFLEHWRETSLDNVFTTLSTTMPRDAPGTLSEALNLDILAFVLRADGFPAGGDELTYQALRGIKVQEKTGPRELTTGALVVVAGCLVPGPGNTWILTSATEPVRIRSSQNSTPEELKAWDRKPAGTKTFGLMDAQYYSPESHLGQKVEAKGLLIRSPGNDRINLTAFRATDSKCGL